MIIIIFNKKFILYLKFIIINLYFIFLIEILKNKNNANINNNNPLSFNSFEELKFNITSINYSFSLKYNISKIEYKIAFYNQNKKIIIPSHLTLYYNLHIFCHTYISGSNIFIKYIGNIYKNIYYHCEEYINLNQHIKFGIKIYKKFRYIEFSTIYLFKSDLINFNKIMKNNYIFDPLNQINFYKKTSIKSNKFGKLFYRNLILVNKYHSISKENKWYFKNIYNNYFCFCIYSNNSRCLYKNVNKKCKYYLYLNIIDKHRYLYKKTNYLLSDFASIDTAPGEAYLVFKEMLRQNLSAHFMSKREDIIQKYNSFNNFFNLRNPVILNDYYINGEFIEKYLDLFLKLKVVISGAKIFAINNLFYYLEYITYICLGHGISYLKDFLYKDYYSYKIYNKILLPPSNIIVSNAKKYGWNDKKIIRIGLPRWDIFFEYDNKFQKDENYNKKSIFIMFTWRDLNQNKSISKYYFKNLFNLLDNQKLNHELKRKNFTLFFSLHHMIEQYKVLFYKNKIIKYANQDQIIDCLIKSSLLVSDFSSIIFDIMARKKPFIIYIPDYEDPNLYYIYNMYYYNIINNLKNGAIKFENVFFNINKAIDKIVYYINNNFKLDLRLKQFYEQFNLFGGNNTSNFIKYVKNIY